MKFNPIESAEIINQSYKEYIKSTFYIKDKEFRKEYNKEIDNFEFAKGPYLKWVDAFKLDKSLEKLSKDGIISSKFESLFKDDLKQYQRPLYLHQEKAIKTAIEDKNMIVTTGTGSGKTECFLYPILNYLFEEESKNELCPGVRVLLLYPMNALANDQMQRFREILKNYPSITFGSYTGETKNLQKEALENYHILHNNEEPLTNELISREEMIDSPPHILVTNYAMLEYLLLRPKENVFFDDVEFSKYWKYIVLDEAHVYSGASGMEVSILMRRLFHRIPYNKKIRYILTSATLGNESANNDIKKFGKDLCANSEFSSDSIIRATREKILSSPQFSIDLSTYKKILELIENDDLNQLDLKNQILEIFDTNSDLDIKYDKNETIEEILFSILSRDKLYFTLREYLFDGAITIKELSEKLNVEIQKIVCFVNIASFAHKNGAKLLDSKYHHFIRTLEGAYVSFYPKKTLSLVPKKSVIEKNDESKVFKLSVCQFCGTLYLEGEIRNFKLEQSTKFYPDYFMVIDDEFINTKTTKDINKLKAQIKETNNSVLRLCTKCGLVANFNSKLQCNCSRDAQILIKKVNKKEEDKLIHKCEYCNTISARNSILRGFYLGQDASTAVVCEALYNQIPYSRIKKTSSQNNNSNPFITNKIKDEFINSKRMLMFSDSRQDAAYFASYFQYTYDVFFKRKLMLKSCQNLMNNYEQDFKTGIPLTVVADKMRDVFSNLDNVKLTPDIISKEVWKTVISEFKDFSRNSLHSIGWLDLQINDENLINNEVEIEGVKFSIEQSRMIAQLILDYGLKHGALLLPELVSMTEKDWGDFDFSSKQPVLTRSDSGLSNVKYNEKAIVPTESNIISKYLDKIIKDKSVDTKKIIDFYFSNYFTTNYYNIFVPLKGHPNLYKINSKKLVIKVKDYHNFEKYKCNLCGRLTTVNINNICPSYRCNGELEKYNFNESNSKDYYLNQYNIDDELKILKIKEHTAQLSKETAQKYQQKFIEGDINILSCSTTFEMGVDVGNLESVFMKNIPPKPSKYIQRAGRAGRRLNSTAFSLTFCKLSPHDFYFYNNPTKMINGKVSPPLFKIDNYKIVRRHVYAILLSNYWKELFPLEDNISEFLSDESYNKIISYIDNLPNDVYKYIQKVVPSSLNNDIDKIIEKYKVKILSNSKLEYESNIKEYTNLINILDIPDVEKRQNKKIDWLLKMRKTYQDEKIISYYSKNNLIPKYGFPVDTVELKTDLCDNSYNSNDNGLSLQRDLIQAISDYAPGSEVIADGQIYTSRYIKKPLSANKELKQYLIEICDNPKCGKVTKKLYTGNIDYKDRVCSQCGQSTINKYLMISPDSGFYVEPKIEKATTKKPRKTYRTQFYYLGEGFEGDYIQAKKYLINNLSFYFFFSPNYKLLLLNKSDFLIC